jgi:HlyD family secretion protein
MGRLKKVLAAVIFIAAATAIATVIWLFGRDETAPRTITVARRDVVQDVAFTGNVQSKTRADLSFTVAGTLTDVAVTVGEEVETGRTLARLDTTTAQLELAKARADRASAEEEARLAWKDKAEALSNIEAENNRTLAKRRQEVRDAKTELDQDRATFQQTARDDGDTAATTLAARAALLAAESKWHTAQRVFDETLKTIEKTAASAAAAADLAHAQYLGTKQAAPQVAGLSSLQASEALARHQAAQGSLVAPFSGVVTAIHQETNEYVSAGARIITLETTDELELVAQVPETDAIKITTGLPATVTLDAFELTEEWPARVARVSPAAAVVEGVPTYEVLLELDQRDDRLLPDLTANITVHVARREGAIAVPRRAIVVRDTQQFVRVMREDGKIEEQEVTTGLAGSDGAIEITGGIHEGEQVVVSTVVEE